MGSCNKKCTRCQEDIEAVFAILQNSFFFFSYLPIPIKIFDLKKMREQDFTDQEITARMRKMIIIHFPIVHAILPIIPKIMSITTIMRNRIPSAKSQSRTLSHFWMSVHYPGFYNLR
jgi:hypothetical protein